MVAFSSIPTSWPTGSSLEWSNSYVVVMVDSKSVVILTEKKISNDILLSEEINPFTVNFFRVDPTTVRDVRISSAT